MLKLAQLDVEMAPSYQERGSLSVVTNHQITNPLLHSTMHTYNFQLCSRLFTVHHLRLPLRFGIILPSGGCRLIATRIYSNNITVFIPYQ